MSNRTGKVKGILKGASLRLLLFAKTSDQTWRAPHGCERDQLTPQILRAWQVKRRPDRARRTWHAPSGLAIVHEIERSIQGGALSPSHLNIGWLCTPEQKRLTWFTGKAIGSQKVLGAIRSHQRPAMQHGAIFLTTTQFHSHFPGGFAQTRPNSLCTTELVFPTKRLESRNSGSAALQLAKRRTTPSSSARDSKRLTLTLTGFSTRIAGMSQSPVSRSKAKRGA